MLVARVKACALGVPQLRPSVPIGHCQRRSRVRRFAVASMHHLAVFSAHPFLTNHKPFPTLCIITDIVLSLSPLLFTWVSPIFLARARSSCNVLRSAIRLTTQQSKNLSCLACTLARISACHLASLGVLVPPIAPTNCPASARRT